MAYQKKTKRYASQFDSLFFLLSGTIKNNKIGYLKGISNRYNIR